MHADSDVQSDSRFVLHAVSASAAGQPLDLTFDNRGDWLFSLGLKHGLLKILTLGFYSFWAKTDLRRRIWSFTRINGEPIEYTGTGKELFLGFLIIVATVIVPVILSGLAVVLASGGNKAALGLYQLVVYGLFFLLFGNAMYRAQRYRLSRTRWRGIRGALTGSPGRYGWTYFWTLVVPFAAAFIVSAIAVVVATRATGSNYLNWVLPITLVLALWVLPWRANVLQADMIRDMYFGDQRLWFSGKAAPLYKSYLAAWLGSAVLFFAAFGFLGRIFWGERVLDNWNKFKIPPSIGQTAEIVVITLVTFLMWSLITSWYRAQQIKHFAKHTHIQSASFRSTATGHGLVWLTLSNWLISTGVWLLVVMISAALVYNLGLVPTPAQTLTPSAAQSEPQLVIYLTVLPIFILFTTVAAAITQLRSARYFMSNLKLDGTVDLARLLQSSDSGPRRGEGLAQMFDVDAF